MTRTPAAFWWTSLAAALGAAMTGALLLYPVYSDGRTVLEVNPEPAAYAAVLAPLVVSATAWLLLHVACRSDRRAPRTLARVLAWGLVALAVVSLFSIGALLAPVAVALAIGASLTPVRER